MKVKAFIWLKGEPELLPCPGCGVTSLPPVIHGNIILECPECHTRFGLTVKTMEIISLRPNLKVINYHCECGRMGVCEHTPDPLVDSLVVNCETCSKPVTVNLKHPDNRPNHRSATADKPGES